MSARLLGYTVPHGLAVLVAGEVASIPCWPAASTFEATHGRHRGLASLHLVHESGPTDLYGALDALPALVARMVVGTGLGSTTGGVRRVFLDRLDPGGEIRPHVDLFPNGPRRRLHAVLSSDGGTFTTWPAGDAVTVTMHEGEVWEVDATQEHAVTNPTGTGRLHLVVDVAA